MVWGAGEDLDREVALRIQHAQGHLLGFYLGSGE